jgi:hypothetical protein
MHEFATVIIPEHSRRGRRNRKSDSHPDGSGWLLARLWGAVIRRMISTNWIVRKELAGEELA